MTGGVFPEKATAEVEAKRFGHDGGGRRGRLGDCQLFACVCVCPMCMSEDKSHHVLRESRQEIFGVGWGGGGWRERGAHHDRGLSGRLSVAAAAGGCGASRTGMEGGCVGGMEGGGRGGVD